MTQAFDAAVGDTHALEGTGRSELRCVTVSRVEAFQDLRDELEDLCDDLCEENVFYEPWMVNPALTHLDRKRAAISFLCLYEWTGSGRLCGFFPLMRMSLHPLLPLRTYQSWHHPHCFRCTPLVRKGFARPCWNTLFDWLEQQPVWRRMLHLHRLPADGEVEQALRSVLDQRATLHHALLEHESAFLHIAPGSDGGSDGSSEKVLRQAMSGSTLGKLRRQQRRLAESGELVFAEASELPDFDQVLGQFLRLEASGWKGRKGTALACNAHEEAFFRTVIGKARDRGQLSFLTMRLGGKLLAAQSSLVSHSGSFLFKTAYDESYSKYSPGVLLEIEHLHRMHAPNYARCGQLHWADSCAGPGDGPVYRCWPERRTIREYRIACGNNLPTLIVTLWPLLRRAYHFLQQHKADGQTVPQRALRPSAKA